MSVHPPARDGNDRFSLLRLAADSRAELDARITRLREHLRGDSHDYALVQSPGVGAHRLALLCHNRRDALAALDGQPGKGSACQLFTGQATPEGPDVVFLLPGLGDHRPHMAADLYRTEEVFRQAFEQCADIAHRNFDLDLRALVYPAPDPDTAKPAPAGTNPARPFDLRALMGRGKAPTQPERGPLDETSIAQPAVFAIEYALARLWQSCGVQPTAMIGYSLGEYTAACLSGVLPLDDALALVVQRARLIHAQPGGAMLAVSLSAQQLTPRLGDLSMSAINGSELCVVAGPDADIAALQAQLTADGIASRSVRTSHAFHSTMMEPVVEPLTRLLTSFDLRPPDIPYMSNVTGTATTAEQATDPAHWARHVSHPVRFADGIRELARAAGRLFLEVGPGQTLTQLTTLNLAAMLSSDRDATSSPAVPALGPSATGLPDRAVWLAALGRLWVAGAPVDDALMARAKVPASVVGEAAPPQSIADAATSDEPAAAMTEIESALAAMWRKLLSTEHVVADSDFFELGGNSLLASQLVFHVRRRFRVTLSLRALYRASTVRAQATLVEQALNPAASPVESSPESVPPESPVLPEQRPTSGPTSGQTAQHGFRLPNGLAVAHQSEAETRHFYADIFTHRGYLRHGLRLADGACIFDVGANIGLFTLFAHLECRRARIFSFEPAPVLFAHLAANVERHEIDAQLFNCGLALESGEAQFTFYPRSSGMSSLHADELEEKSVLAEIMRNQKELNTHDMGQIMEHSDELLDLRFEKQVFTCQLRTLSEVIAEHGVERIDFLKIDVQKAEMDVLCGLHTSDWNKVRQVALEVHDIDGRVDEMRALLAHRGFTVHVVQDELYRNTNIHNIYASHPER